MTRPQDMSYDCMNFHCVASSYWLSPRGSTAARFELKRMFDVASSLHAPEIPAPPFQRPSAGSQAMSPAVPITGSPDDAPPVVPETAVERAERLPALSK